ncbi:MAG: FixH family protein [Roseiarcus sp.]
MDLRMELSDAPSIDEGRRFTGWMALAILAVFFGTIFCANGSLVYYAISTFSGEQETSPYERGLAYDKEIAAARAQDARAWRVSVNALHFEAGAPALIDITMHDADDQPIQGLAVTAALEFPADKKLDRRTVVNEAEPGDYRADAAMRPGQWDLVIEARRDGERLFRSRNRIVLR